MSPKDKRPSPAQAAERAQRAADDSSLAMLAKMAAPIAVEPGEVGETYSITYERHATKPLWRLRERSVTKGKTFEQATEWREFHRFSPELLMAQGRQKAFLFPQFAAGVPQLVRRGS